MHAQQAMHAGDKRKFPYGGPQINVLPPPVRAIRQPTSGAIRQPVVIAGTRPTAPPPPPPPPPSITRTVIPVTPVNVSTANRQKSLFESMQFVSRTAPAPTATATATRPKKRPLSPPPPPLSSQISARKCIVLDSDSNVSSRGSESDSESDSDRDLNDFTMPPVVRVVRQQSVSLPARARTPTPASPASRLLVPTPIPMPESTSAASRTATTTTTTTALGRPVARSRLSLPLRLPNRAELFMYFILNGYNVYFTGGAGSGKTYNLMRAIAELRAREVPMLIVGQVGTAAAAIGGQTIDSLFMTWKSITNIMKYATSDGVKEKYESITTARVMIVDEVGQVSAKSLDEIDKRLRAFRRNPAPFGGVQLILVGDILQLPPVKVEEVGYYFDADVYPQMFESLQVICMTSYARFLRFDPIIHVLNMLRIGQLTAEVRQLLKTHCMKRPSKNAIHLVSKRISADEINQRTLEVEIDGYRLPCQTFTATWSFKSKYSNVNLTQRMKLEAQQAAEKTFQARSTLVLREGVQVMLLVNLDVSQGYCNGAIGTVLGFDPESGAPLVRFQCKRAGVTVEEEKVIRIHRFTQTFNYIEVTMTQYPLLMATAMTIHKAQGITAPEISFSAMDVTQPNMAYVTISRCPTLSKIHIAGIDRLRVSVNPRALAHWEMLCKRADEQMQAQNIELESQD